MYIGLLAILTRMNHLNSIGLGLHNHHPLPPNLIRALLTPIRYPAAPYRSLTP